MLEQHAEEALHRAEERAMDHHRAVAGVVGADVGEVESLRQLEVELDGRHLPGPADRVARLNGDLRTVERSSAGVEDDRQLELVGREAQRRGRGLPLIVGADRLHLWSSRELEVVVVESVVAQQLEHETQNRDELVAHLLAVQKMCASSWVRPHRG